MAAPMEDSGTQASAGGSGRAMWTSNQRHYLLTKLVDFKARGKAAESGFKKEVWTAITISLNATFSTSYNVEQLKTQTAAMKKEYKNYQQLVSNCSGFGWDEGIEQVTAPDEVWEEVIRSRGPWVKKFRGQAFPNRQLMYTLFDQVVATGLYAGASNANDSPDIPSGSRRRTTSNVSSQSSVPGSGAADGESTSEHTFHRSSSPREQIRKESDLSRFTDTINDAKNLVQSMKNELSVALERFENFAETQIMSTRTKVMCKQVLCIGRNATLFLSMKADAYRDFFELSFELDPRGFVYTSADRPAGEAEQTDCNNNDKHANPTQDGSLDLSDAPEDSDDNDSHRRPMLSLRSPLQVESDDSDDNLPTLSHCWTPTGSDQSVWAQ